jgi:hypothetical protein
VHSIQYNIYSIEPDKSNKKIHIQKFEFIKKKLNIE